MSENVMKIYVVQYTGNFIFIKNLSSKLYQWNLKFRLLGSLQGILRVLDCIMHCKIKVTTTFKLT
jgi:hypothetical protein